MGAPIRTLTRLVSARVVRVNSEVPGYVHTVDGDGALSP